MSKLSLKDLDSKMSDLQSHFRDELVKFREEIVNIRSPDVQNSEGDKLASLINRFNLFEASVNNRLQTLQRQVEDTKKQEEQLYVKVDDILQQTNRNKVVIYGLSEKDGESLHNYVIEHLKNKMEITINKTDIAGCYRVGRKKPGDKKSRPVIVEFYNWRLRDEILLQKRKLKGSKTVCTEILSPLRYKVYITAKQKFGNNDCWIYRGRIGVLQAGETRYVATMSQLDDLIRHSNLGVSL